MMKKRREIQFCPNNDTTRSSFSDLHIKHQFIGSFILGVVHVNCTQDKSRRDRAQILLLILSVDPLENVANHVNNLLM